MPNIVRSLDGKIIGDIDGGVFIKRVDGRIHMLRKPPAWAIDKKAYVEEIEPFCHTIQVVDIHAGLTYITSTKTFTEKRGYMDRGFAPQYFLTLNHWQSTNTNQRKMI